MPVFGFLLGSMIDYLSNLAYFINGETNPLTTITKSETLHNIDIIVIAMVVVGVCSFFTNSLMFSLFNHIGEIFTNTMWTKFFWRLLYKDLEFFDIEEN